MRRKIAIFISIFLITLGVIVAATSLSTASADTTTSSSNTSIFCTDPNHCNLDTWMSNFYVWSVAVGGALAVLVIVWAGYEYATSAGEVEKINKAKEKIIGAVLGLILLVLVALILQAVGSRGAENPFKNVGGSSGTGGAGGSINASGGTSGGSTTENNSNTGGTPASGSNNAATQHESGHSNTNPNSSPSASPTEYIAPDFPHAG
ncbi:MAG: pilin [Patescibacteria group bacterium]|nr:pilin [Patescibacteria group bacterium]